jgi:hypothetical protein
MEQSEDGFIAKLIGWGKGDTQPTALASYRQAWTVDVPAWQVQNVVNKLEEQNFFRRSKILNAESFLGVQVGKRKFAKDYRKMPELDAIILRACRQGQPIGPNAQSQFAIHQGNAAGPPAQYPSGTPAHYPGRPPQYRVPPAAGAHQPAMTSPAPQQPGQSSPPYPMNTGPRPASQQPLGPPQQQLPAGAAGQQSVGTQPPYRAPASGVLQQPTGTHFTPQQPQGPSQYPTRADMGYGSQQQVYAPTSPQQAIQQQPYNAGPQQPNGLAPQHPVQRTATVPGDGGYYGPQPTVYR